MKIRLIGALVGALLLAYVVSGQSPLQVGYSVFTLETGNRAPVGSALFTYTNNSGVLVSQAGVGAVEPIRKGRIFVDENGMRTGLALVNTASLTATVSLVLRDSAGTEVGRQTQLIGAGRHLPRYVDEFFPNRPAGLRGSMTFDSDQPLAAITLRESRNAQAEPLYTTLPVIDVAAAPNATVTFPHIAAGAGFKTELLLMGAGAEKIQGEIRLYSSHGDPMTLSLGDSQVSRIRYEIPAGGTFGAELDAAVFSVGSALAVPDAGSPPPSGSIIFRYIINNHVVTEAGVAATATTTAARIFVDNSGTRTGVAIANPTGSAAGLTLKLMDRNGNVEETVTRTLPPLNQLPIFADELFSNLTEGFSGVMDIRSTVPVAAVTLKLTINSRNEQVLTTLPVANLNEVSSARSLVFPQIAIGANFSTRLIFINPADATPAAGRLTFYQSDATPMIVPMGTQTASQFAYSLAATAGRQFYPGNTAKVASLRLMDPSSNTETSELVVTEGSLIRPHVRVVDSAGESRDDFDVSYALSNTTVAGLNADGSIAGKLRGFSTFVFSTAGVVSTGTISVVRVASGPSGYEANGVVQDLARRLYLVSPQDHAIFLTQSLADIPATYAGTRRLPGLKNDLRLQSQFNRPAFLAFNQSEGSLYVTDSANNVIRRVRPGTSGRVETVAGTGVAGSLDGRSQEATFNSPQGIALDSRGNLWIADSGNHTIRRINLLSGTVETIAGTPGTAGFADGARSAALFRSPVGIAVETESTLEQLERERRGDPAPPVSVIVADSGNGVLRRVKENGDVETLRADGPRAVRFQGSKSTSTSPVGTPYAFDKPTGIAVDAFQNVYVSEPSSSRVRVLLSRRGEVVTGIQSNTLIRPQGLSSTAGGVIVADSGASAREVSYAGPEILSVTPSRVSDRGGEQVTIRGRNFAPDSIVVVAGSIIGAAAIQNTETIVFKMPSTGSGRATITIQHRGGLTEVPLLVDPQSLSSLPVGFITTVAGGTTYAGDGGLASGSRLSYPTGIVIGSDGALYIADSENHRIRRYDPGTGLIHTIAGTGRIGYSGDGGPATAAQLNDPFGMAFDAAGNFFIADAGNNRVRRIDAVTKIITTVAGTGDPGFSGDGGPAIQAHLSPFGLLFDSAGNLNLSDSAGNRIRRIDARTGIITTIAGSGPSTGGYSGDGGPASSARLNVPFLLAQDNDGNLYVADASNFRVRKIDSRTQVISTVAGTGVFGSSGDGGPATQATLEFPLGISVDADGNLYIAASSRIRKVNSTTGVITTIAGGGQLRPSYTGATPATSINLLRSAGVALDAAGNLFMTSYQNQVYRLVLSTGSVFAAAGRGVDSVGDGEAATAATLNSPLGIAFDAQGNLAIADSFNHRIRSVNAQTGVITTVAGTGVDANFGGGTLLSGPANTVNINFPTGVAFDSAGDIYFSEAARLRKVTTSTGMLTTVAGGSPSGSLGDNGPAFAATLKKPSFVLTDRADNIYVSDINDHRVRRISATGIITTIAGNGTGGFTGDNGPANQASLNQPQGLALDANGDLYIVDFNNRRIRKVTVSTGVITTFSSLANSPLGIAIDPQRSQLFTTLYFLPVIYRVDMKTGLMKLVAGFLNLSGYYGDGGPATNALLFRPYGMAIDAQGNIYFADSDNDRVRAIKGPLP